MPQSEQKSFNLLLMQIVGPVLIMAMVGSLVFFLIEVMYRGPHTARLYWVMFLFTCASVLVSRISIEEGRERAMLFGLALAVAVMIASARLVEFSYGGVPMIGTLVVAVLITVVMWCTSKLTWDCTVVDKSRDTSAVGLVDRFRQQIDPSSESQDGSAKRISILERVWKTITGTSKANTPGLWVFYFAMFAFPIFGLGQWFVEANSKSWVFMLFAAYLGSGLCLLAMTSLMSLNRYLATRKLEVPDRIARNWMMLGTGFAAFVILLVMLLPRPASSNSLENMFAWLQSPDRATTKFALGKDGNRDDKGAKKQRVDNDSDGPSVDGDKGKAAGDGEEGEQGSKKGNQSDDSNKSGQQNKQRSKQNQNSKGGDNKQNGNKNNQQQKSNNSDKSKSSDDSQKTDQQQSKDKKNAQQRNTDKQKAKSNNRKQIRQQQKADNQRRDDKQRQNKNQDIKQQRSSSPSKLMQSLSKITKGLVYILGAAALLFVLWMLRDDLANLWALLMGKKKVPSDSPSEERPVPAPIKPPPSFASFNNPFRNGKAKSMFGWQLAQYTMSALEAWAREYGVERELEQTPQEFAYQLRALDANVAKSAGELAKIYGRVAFSKDKVSREDFEPLVKLWDQMSIPLQSKRNRPAVVAPTS